MTPAVETARKAAIEFEIHEYEHDGANMDGAYGMEAAEKMGIPPGQVFKTLVIRSETNALAVGIVPVSHQLSLKAMAKASGFKKVRMAEAADVERATGYVLGGVSPLGQKRQLATVIDESALAFERVYVSAGKRGLEISLSPVDLERLTDAVIAPIADR